jgi:hypothetical protein
VSNLTAINSDTHRALRITAARAAATFASVNIVSVIPREFARLLAHYPIFFGKSSENGQFEPAAVLGFQQGENLFLAMDSGMPRMCHCKSSANLSRCCLGRTSRRARRPPSMWRWT